MGEEMKIIMVGVREYSEKMDVELTITEGMFDVDKPEKDWLGKGRIVIKAFNESGFNRTEVDLMDVILWLRKNKPELLEGK